MDYSLDREKHNYNATASSSYPTPPHIRHQPVAYVDGPPSNTVDAYPFSPLSPNLLTSDHGGIPQYAEKLTSLNSVNSFNRLTTIATLPFEFESSPSQDPPEEVISISTAFHPGTHPPPNTIFSSSDNVFFYVIAEIILDSSPTAFQPHLSAPLSDPQYRDMVIAVDAPSAELNVIMHALYKTSPASHSPDFETIVRSIDRMPLYGFSPETLIQPSTPLYELLLSHAPLHPLGVYALGAHYQIHELASMVSSHLLSHNLSDISDDMAERIGPVYLNRLFLLHVGRFAALKGILLQAPHPHAATRNCGFEDQKELTRAWALVAAFLAWDASPDLSTQKLARSLNPLLDNLTCAACKQALRGRIKDVMVQWTSVKRTI